MHEAPPVPADGVSATGNTRGWTYRALSWVEVVGNKLPDPAALFLLLLLVVWLLSWMMSGIVFTDVDPRTGQPIVVHNQLTGTALAAFLSKIVPTFMSFPPLGVVLVALLGVGLAEQTGLINAALRRLLSFTSRKLLTPVLITVGILSHTAVDVGYVLVIPLGAVIFYAAGRHPLAGIAAAFAAVSGAFSANFLPSALDPLLQAFTESSARIVDPSVSVNPLVNFYFTASSSLLIIALGWWLTDRVVEPRLNREATLDGDMSEMPRLEPLTPLERRGLRLAGLVALAGLGLLLAVTWPEGSPLRDPKTGDVTSSAAPIMQSIVPLIFLLFVLPAIVYGYAAKTVKNHRDVIDGMSKTMSTMGYYVVLAFFCSQFIAAFTTSNLGVLLALKGAGGLQALALPPQLTIVGIIFLTAVLDLFVGSASAKWALMAPILVPMLMLVDIHPGLTQAAYRIGDSSSNIITPLMPYFPLVVVFCRKYVTRTGIGTVVAMMLPYSVVFILAWSAYLLIYWTLGIPLGVQSEYIYIR